MKQIQKHIRLIIGIFCVLFIALAVYFVYAINIYGGRWFSSPYNRRLEAQKSKVIAGSILDRNGKVLASSNAQNERSYSSDRDIRLAVSHIVGEDSGLTSNGAESFFAKYLLGFSDNVLERIFQQFSSTPARGSNVQLSIDAELSAHALRAMANYDGAVVVMNYKTGEVLASVSKPGFDASKLDTVKAMESEQSFLVNRATMGKYAPGSVFKLITATAAIRYLPNIQEETWDCGGPMLFDPNNRKFLPNAFMSGEEDKKLRAEQEKAAASKTPTPSASANAELDNIFTDDGVDLRKNYLLLRDYQSSYHGEISLERAIAVSCNHTLASIALEVGIDKMKKTAAEYGFGEDFLFSDLVVYPSNYTQGKNEYDTAWSAVGQYQDLVTPMHMCMIAGSIANDGQMMEPKLLRSAVNARNYQTMLLKPTVFKHPLSKKEADLLTTYMRATITKGTGSAAAIKGLEVCGKTGTAEVSSDKKVGNHAWFVGFIDDVNHPIAIAVILEHAGSGGGKAAPVAGSVLKKAVALGY